MLNLIHINLTLTCLLLMEFFTIRSGMVFMWAVVLLTMAYAFRVTKRICEELSMYENWSEKTTEEEKQIIYHVSAMIGLSVWFMFLAMKHGGAGWLLFAVIMLTVFISIFSECKQITVFRKKKGKLHLDYYHPPSSQPIDERLRKRKPKIVKPG